MDPRVSSLVRDYLDSVSLALKLLDEAGIPIPATNVDWAYNGIPQRGELPGGVTYFKHGYGCSVLLPGGGVDFDFGERGETNGFDLWRLIDFAGKRLPDYGFGSEKELEACFKAEVEAGSIVFSGYILHFVREGFS